MIVAQIAQKLASEYLEVSDLSQMDVEGKQSLLDALNAGIEDYYEAAPEIYKTTPMSALLEVPVSKTLELTHGSTVIGGGEDHFEEDWKGQTVRIDGAGTDNEITGEYSLLDPYSGPTGTHSATVYFDAMPLPDVVEKLKGAPEIDRERKLTLQDGPTRRCARNEVGCPRYYRVEPVGVSQAGEPAFYLRIIPMPNEAVLIRLSAVLHGRNFTLEDFDGTEDIGMQERQVRRLLMPLVAFHLKSHRNFRKDLDARDVNAAARLAKERTEKLPVRMDRERRRNVDAFQIHHYKTGRY